MSGNSGRSKKHSGSETASGRKSGARLTASGRRASARMRAWQETVRETDRGQRKEEKRSDRKWQLFWLFVGALLTLIVTSISKHFDKAAPAQTTQQANP